MPAGKIGAGDVADFAAANEGVERFESFFDGSELVEAVHVVDVDVIGVEAAEAGFGGADDVIAGGTGVVWPLAETKRGFGGNEKILALAVDGLAEDFLGEAVGINIGSVEEIDASFETDINQALRFVNSGFAPGLKEFGAAAEGAGAKAELGNFEARMA